MGNIVYSNAIIVDVRKADGTEYDSKNWRANGIGRNGYMTVMESEDLSLGNFFIRFADIAGFCSFRTGCGSIQIDGTYLVLTTQNSIYVFEPYEENIFPGADWIEEHIALYRAGRGLELAVSEDNEELEKMMRESFEKYVLRKE